MIIASYINNDTISRVLTFAEALKSTGLPRVSAPRRVRTSRTFLHSEAIKNLGIELANRGTMREDDKDGSRKKKLTATVFTISEIWPQAGQTHGSRYSDELMDQPKYDHNRAYLLAQRLGLRINYGL